MKKKKVAVYIREDPPTLRNERVETEIADPEEYDIPAEVGKLAEKMILLETDSDYRKCVCFGVYGVFENAHGKRQIADWGNRIDQKDMRAELRIAFRLAKHFEDQARLEERKLEEEEKKGSLAHQGN